MLIAFHEGYFWQDFKKMLTTKREISHGFEKFKLHVYLFGCNLGCTVVPIVFDGGVPGVVQGLVGPAVGLQVWSLT